MELTYRIFGQTVSKYMIVSISMAFFVLKGGGGGEYGLRYLCYKQLNRKIVKMSLVDKRLKR